MIKKIATLMLIFIMQGCFSYQGEYYSVDITPKTTNMDWEVSGRELHLSIKRINKPTDHFQFLLDDLYQDGAATWYIEDGESIMKVESYRVIDSNKFSFKRCNVTYKVRRIRHGYKY